MRIHSIEAIAIDIPLSQNFGGATYSVLKRSTIVTRLRTQGGLVSEVYNGDNREQGVEIVRIIQEELAPLVAGMSILESESVFSALFARTIPNRDRKVLLEAIACVDCALWDVLGKAAGQSVHALLGGFRAEVPIISIGGYYREGKTLAEVKGDADDLLKRLGAHRDDLEKAKSKKRRLEVEEQILECEDETLGLMETLELSKKQTALISQRIQDSWTLIARAEKEIEKYREMISDPMSNPGYLAVDAGEALWKTARGTKNVSLETCDLGQGAGKLDGAYAGLPRYFADADKVQDIEARLLWCMENVQGLDTKDVRARRFSGPGKPSDMQDLVAYIANKSNGAKFKLPLEHAKEKQAFALGEALFYRRASMSDFSCATCHATDGQRIRLQGLPNLIKPGAPVQQTMGGWPTYRVSQSAVRTMQHRMWDCYWQMRMPDVAYTSDVTVALITFLTKQAEGGEIMVPSIKR